MGKIFTASAWKCLMVLFLLWGCQSQVSKDDSTINNSSQNQNFTVFGVSQDIYTQALEEGQKAKQELEILKRDMSLIDLLPRLKHASLVGFEAQAEMATEG